MCLSHTTNVGTWESGVHLQSQIKGKDEWQKYGKTTTKGTKQKIKINTIKCTTYISETELPSIIIFGQTS